MKMSKLTIKPVIPKITINRIHKTFLTQRLSSSLNLIAFKKFSEPSAPRSTSHHQYRENYDDFLIKLRKSSSPRELIETKLKTEDILEKCAKHGSVQDFQQILSYLIAHECDDLIDLKALFEAVVLTFGSTRRRIEKLEILFGKVTFFKSQNNLDLRDLMLIILNCRRYDDSVFDILTHLLFKLTRDCDIEKSDLPFNGKMSTLYKFYRISQNPQALTHYLSKPFKEMIERDFSEGVKVFIGEGVDPAQKIEEENTLFRYGIFSGTITEKNTPLYIAVRSDSARTVQLLLEHVNLSNEEEAVKLAFIKAGKGRIDLKIIESLLAQQGPLKINDKAIDLVTILSLRNERLLSLQNTNSDLDIRIQWLMQGYSESNQISSIEHLENTWERISLLLFGEGVKVNQEPDAVVAQESQAPFRPILTNYTKPNETEAVLINAQSKMPSPKQ